ncbi:MAG TPA: hypothetical protein VIR78_06680 [Malonomonas sp.]
MQKNSTKNRWQVNFKHVLFSAALAIAIYGNAQALPLATGVDFAQVNFTYPSATQMYSPYGQIFLDYSKIPDSGYVNVKTSAGWVVQNMPVFGGSGLPGLSMMFDLGFSGPQQAPFFAAVDYSPDPITNDATLTGPQQSFGVLRHVEHNASNDSGAFGPPASPTGKMSVTFDPNGKTTLPVINTISPSVEQDHNQCGPAAVANSLAYLNQRFDVTLKHKHIPGIAGNPPDSLVGQIDLLVPRAQGEGVWRSDLLDGKLKYLDKHGPKGLIIKHQGVFDKEGAVTINADRTQGSTTSKFKGGLVTIDFLMNEIHHGEDVEMDLTFGGKFDGGHEIMITGGDFILGRPWVTFVHDAVQGNNMKGTGLFDGGYGFAWLDDPGGGDFLQFKGYVIGADGFAAGVRNVITESVPEPSYCWPAG